MAIAVYYIEPTFAQYNFTSQGIVAPLNFISSIVESRVLTGVYLDIGMKRGIRIDKMIPKQEGGLKVNWKEA